MIYCRDGRIRVGDEIINVCGKRLRGLTIEEAIKALKQPKHELDIVEARETNSNSWEKCQQSSYFTPAIDQEINDNNDRAL